MKRTLLTALAACAFGAFANAQVVTDSVKLGTSFANQSWYSFTAGEKANVSNTNWDIAFAATANPTSDLTASVLFNGKIGSLYEVPGSSVASFGTVDTAGISTWKTLYNSDTTWALGAFNRTESKGSLDYGFGTYNSSNHKIEANRVFVVKYTSGVVRKLYITLNSMTATYLVTHSNLDGSDLHTDAAVLLTSYGTKNFVYFDLRTNGIIDREPATADWDLTFTQYVSLYSQGGPATPQLVSGILVNHDYEVAQVYNVNQSTFVDYSTATFGTEIGQIGHDWKTLITTPPFRYEADDSLVNFVRPLDQSVWKVIIKEMTLGSQGSRFTFTKEKLFTAGINENKGSNNAVIVYPNPASGNNVNLLLSNSNTVSKMNIDIVDLNGKTVYTEVLNNVGTFQQVTLSNPQLGAGIYVINVNADGASIQQKLIVQ